MADNQKGNLLGSLGRVLGFGGYQAVLQVLQSLATSEACVDRVAEEIYCRETGQDWRNLDRRQQAIWRNRATSSILGFKAFLSRS